MFRCTHIPIYDFFGVDLIIEYANWPTSNSYMIYGFSISVMFIAIAGVFKSYFQGREMMVPTALTQIIENISKAVFGLSIIFILLKAGQSTPVVVGGAALGVSLAFMLSAIFIVWYYMKHRKHIQDIETNSKKNI